ncbi:hypothetical protein VPH35_129875 [Triticum aestivum]
MRPQVDLMIEGVPSHAWTIETAAELLGSACLIESLAPETKNREDLSLFKLRAWCVDPEEVPVDKRLWVPEPETNAGPGARMPTSRALLEYRTIIHIGRIRDHEGPERWLRPPSSDGSGQSGVPEDSGGYSGQGKWRVMPWTRGVRDHRGGAPAGGAPGHSYRQALLGRIGPSAWRIPPMDAGAAAMACALRASSMVNAAGLGQEDVTTDARAPAMQQPQLAIEDPGRSLAVGPGLTAVVADPMPIAVPGQGQTAFDQEEIRPEPIR